MNTFKKTKAVILLLIFLFSATGCGSKAKDTLINTVYSNNGFVFNQNVKWETSRNDLINSLPDNSNLIPENKNYEETRNFKAKNGTATVWPSATLQFKDIDAKFDVLYEFNADDQLYCGRYRAKFKNSDSNSLKVMQQVLKQIFADYPDSSLGGKEFADTVKQNEKVEIYWEGENDTLLRIQAMSVAETYFIDIQAGLKPQMMKIEKNSN